MEGLADDEVCIGDRYQIGSAVFEVTQPRVTCYRVGIRMNDPRIPALLVSHHRPGLYFRVLEEGEVQAGDKIIKLSWWPLHLVATLAVLTVICVLAYALLKKSGELLGELKAIFTDDTAILIIGAYGIALINFILAVIVSHVRLNYYDDRYLTLTSLFGPVSGILTLFLIINWFARRSPIREFAKPIFLLAGIILLAVKFPSGSYWPEYRTVEETALALAQKSPRAILLGGYWETYIFAALQPVNTMTPVPSEGQENRMPWTRDMVRLADQVVVEYRRSGLIEADQPPQHLSQYGNSLRLAEPKWYENGDFAFALYVRDD